MSTSYFRTSSPFWTVFDANGNLAAGGRIDTFRSEDKSERKATYLDAGGNFPAPNPLRLDEIGQLPSDIYWADDEKYYIEFYDKNGKFINSFDGFPSEGSGGGSTTVGIDTTNNLINGQFRFHGDETFDPLTTDEITVANRWTFIKSNASATDKIVLNLFNLGDSIEGTPIYNMNYICTGQGSGETFKYFQQKMGDARTFEQSVQTFSMQVYSDVPRTIEISFVQNFGTGGIPSPEVVTSMGTFNLTGGVYEKISGTITVPSVGGKTLGTNGDDFISIRINMPLDSVANIAFTNAYLASTNLVFPYPRLTKEKEDSLLLGSMIPEIGDDDEGKAITVNNKYSYELAFPVPVGGFINYGGVNLPAGWLYCNGGTYSISQNDGKYERLRTAIERYWGGGIDSWLAASSNASIVIANSYNNSVTAAAAGTSGFTVTTLNTGNNSNYLFDIITTQGMGLNVFATKCKVKGQAPNLANGNAALTAYTSVRSGNAGSYDVAVATFKAASAMAGGQYFFVSTPSVNYYFWYTINGAGSDPVVPGRTGIQVAILSTDTAEQVALKTMFKMAGYQTTVITCTAASAITSGSYFTINTNATPYYAWFKVGGVGSDPKVAGKTGIMIELATSDTAAQVAAKVTGRLNQEHFQVPDLRGGFIRGRDVAGVWDAEIGRRAGGTYPGSFQFDQVIAHAHNYTYPDRTTTSVQGGPNVVPNPVGTVASQTSQNIDFLNPGGYLPIGQGGYETRPYNIYADFIIKY